MKFRSRNWKQTWQQEKYKLGKERKQKNTSNGKYLEAMKNARTVYQVKCKAKTKRLIRNIMQRDGQKCDVVKINQDIIGEQCIRNDGFF